MPFSCIAFGGSFQGHKVFLIKYAMKHHVEVSVPHVIIPLLGRFKTEDGNFATSFFSLHHVFKNPDRVMVAAFVVEVKQGQGLGHGPACSDCCGKPVSPHWVEMEDLDHLQHVQSLKPDTVCADVNVYEEYGISRSFQRGATTEARNKVVSENDINTMNRWRNVENTNGKHPRLKVQDHYSDISMMISTLLSFSSAFYAGGVQV